MAHDAIEVVVKAGTDTVEHAWYMTEENCHTLLESDAYLVGTLSNAWAMAHRGAEVGFPWTEMMAADLPAILERFRMAIDIGVKSAAGTAVGGKITRWCGASARAIAVSALCAMSRLQGIAPATLDAARAIHLQDSIGSLEAGKVADLVV